MQLVLILLYFCLSASSVYAQTAQAQAAASVQSGQPLMAQPSAAAPDAAVLSAADEWQMTVDVVKGRVIALMEENARLLKEADELKAQEQKLYEAVAAQGVKNEELAQYLKERRGRTDQQYRIDELNNQIKVKRSVLTTVKRDAQSLKEQAQAWQHTLDAKKFKLSEYELRHKVAPAALAAVPGSGDAELDALRKDLENQKTQEATLESQLASLNIRKDVPAADADKAVKDTADLKRRLDVLRRQKADLMAKVNAAAANRPNPDRFSAMQSKKSRLEMRIRDYEAQINVLKDGAASSGTWLMQRKRLIHDVVGEDARNDQMRQHINTLREDIALLRGQIATLEKRVTFSQGRGVIKSPTY